MTAAKKGSSENTRLVVSEATRAIRVGPLGHQAARRLVGHVAEGVDGAENLVTDVRRDGRSSR